MKTRGFRTSPGRKRKIPARVEVFRDTGRDSMAFMACVKVGRWRRHEACMPGRNPRNAVAAALHRAAKEINRRGGAFARYR